jgi:START domain
VRQIYYKAVWPTSPRDFQVLTTWEEHPDGTVAVISKSIPSVDDTVSRSSRYVRGKIIVGGYSLKQAGEHCEVSLLSHTELGGSIPASLVNSLSSTAPFKMLESLRAMFEDK